MTKQEALGLFGGSARLLGKHLDISEQAINQWRSDAIPPLRAQQLRDYKASLASDTVDSE